MVEAYAAEAARSQDGTIVCIAESAVAIMQVSGIRSHPALDPYIFSPCT